MKYLKVNQTQNIELLIKSLIIVLMFCLLRGTTENLPVSDSSDCELNIDLLITRAEMFYEHPCSLHHSLFVNTLYINNWLDLIY